MIDTAADNFADFEMIIQIFSSTLRVATPLIFAALGGFFAERSGVIDIALEGKMLVGACAAAVVAHLTGSPWLGCLAGGVAASLLGGLYGTFTVLLESNQIVTGTAFNLLAAGLVPFFLNLCFGTPGSSPALKTDERFIVAPYYFVWVSVLAVALWFRYGRSGLWLRFAGENPAALATSGVSVVKTRIAALFVGGFLAGVGGSMLSLFLASAYSRNMTAGRGFMALAALILGSWKPIPVASACLLFGLADAIQIRLEFAQISLSILEPFAQTLPHLATLIIIAGFFTKSRPPAALGKHR